MKDRLGRARTAALVVSALAVVMIGGALSLDGHGDPGTALARSARPGAVTPADLAQLNRRVRALERRSPNPLVEAELEAWHTVGDAGEPAFATDWAAGGGGTTTVPAFFKDASGFVHLKGNAIKPTPAGGLAPTTIYTLPAGYRPSETWTFPAILGQSGLLKIATILVKPDGTVGVGSINYDQTIAVQFVFMDGMTFRK
jgi:hypothetical protein